MLRIGVGIRAPLRFAQTRSYAEGGGFEISDYLSRIEAITKSRKPQSRGPAVQGKKKPTGSPQNRSQKTSQRPRTQRPQAKNGQPGVAAGEKPAAANASSSSRGQRAEGKTGAQFIRRPRTQAPANRPASRDGIQQQRMAKPPSADSARQSGGTGSEGFTPLSSISQEPLPKGGRRSAGASRAPRTRVKGSRKPRATERTGEGALMARRALQGLEQDSSFLHPQDGLAILMRNQNSTVNGFISVDDVSLQALQPNLVSSAVSYNSRVRSLLRDLPEKVLSDRKQLNALVRKHVQGSYDDGVVLEATGGNISTESLVKVLNANPSFTGETKQFLAKIGSGKVPIKHIARNA